MIRKMSHATIFVNNQEEALNFYRDKLGFEVRNDVGYNGMHWITVGPAGQPGTSIVLYPPAATPGLTDDEGATVIEAVRAVVGRHAATAER